MTATTWLRLGALLGFAAVAAGSFGAHWLEGRLKDPAFVGTGPEAGRLVTPERRLAVFDTGVQYHATHALAVVAVALAMGLAGAGGRPVPLGLTLAGWAFVVGIALFSGSLYAMGLTGIRWLGAITPLGGVLFLIGWFALAWAGLGSDAGTAAGPGSP